MAHTAFRMILLATAIGISQMGCAVDPNSPHEQAAPGDDEPESSHPIPASQERIEEGEESDAEHVESAGQGLTKSLCLTYPVGNTVTERNDLTVWVCTYGGTKYMNATVWIHNNAVPPYGKSYYFKDASIDVVGSPGGSKKCDLSASMIAPGSYKTCDLKLSPQVPWSTLFSAYASVTFWETSNPIFPFYSAYTPLPGIPVWVSP